MDLAVLVKRVPDPEAHVSVESGSLKVEEKHVMGFFDEIALEKALRIRTALGGTVTVLSAGTPVVGETLRKGIAMGADKAVRVEIADGLHDPLTRARALAAAVTKTGAKLVLCGKLSGDEEAGFTGPAVAALLGVPCVSGVLSLDADAEKGSGRREIEGGSEAFAVSWPAVLTAARGLADPRVPQIMGVMKAMKAPVDVWPAAELLAGGADASGPAPVYEAPPVRGAVRMIEGPPDAAAAELVKILREEAKVL